MFLFSFFLPFSAEFWNEPHMTIVRIAEKSIPSYQSEWLNILFGMWPSEPATMVSAATWHDDVSGFVARVMSQWHFSDGPIVDPNFNLTDFEETYNVTSVLNDTINALFDPTTTNIWALHFLFRNLAHFIGDAHTPCHTAAYYSEQYPTGDRGGNSVKLNKTTCHFGTPCDQLHKMWDSGVLNFQYQYLSSDSILQEFEYNVSHIMKMHSPGALPTVHILDPSYWEKETHQVAVEYAYGKITDLNDTTVNNKNLAPDYFVEGQQQAELLIVKAGYRLSFIIQQFFAVHNPEDPRMATVEVIPAREIVLWVVDSLIIAAVIVYSVLIILKKDVSCKRLQGPKYEEVATGVQPTPLLP